MRYLIIRQIRSPIRQSHREHAEATLRGLQLGRMNRVSAVEYTPANRGMIAAIPHMIKILDVLDRIPTAEELDRYG